METVLDRPTRRSDVDLGDDPVAHLVEGRGKVARAYVTGEELTAVCGAKFIPTRDPEGRQLCESCRQLV